MKKTKSIHRKIQQVRVELQDAGLKKTGNNNGRKYFELRDFMPKINELVNKQGLFTKFSMNKESASLRIIGDEDEVSFTIDKVEAELPEALAIQSRGATITYYRRYLYMIAFEIAETDFIDASKKPELEDSELETMQNCKTIEELHTYVVKLKKERGASHQKLILTAFNKRKGELTPK